jgi:DNA repair protein RecN (Recombination protein N)
MLVNLRVTDFLLVADAQLDLAPGLNVLTGETGTGKSILLHALGLLLGGRASSDWIRREADGLRVSGLFRADARALRGARTLGIPLEGDELLITREVRRQGGGRCFVNGERVLVGTLRKLGAQLVEVHGQRDEERFRRPESQRDLLDLYGGHADLRRRVRAGHRAVVAAREALAAHDERIAQLARDEEYLRFQVAEIEKLEPQADEIEALRERIGGLRAGRRRVEFLALAEELLRARSGSVLEALEELDHRLGAVEATPEAWASLREELGTLVQGARSAARRVAELRRTAHAAADELPALEERLAALERLQRKHRRPLAEIVALLAAMRADLERLGAASAARRGLAAELDSAREALATAAAELGRRRQRAGRRLAGALEGELAEIGMAQVRFRVALPAAASRAGESGPSGGERVVFEVETNPGEGFRPLGEIASGGEMARLALGLRVVLGERGRTMLTVFDEIDAGLGGGAARAVARRLAAVAAHRQVLLVTHLPVIAAQGSRHFQVEKQLSGRRAAVNVQPVSGGLRVAEIARMLGGDAAGTEARRHAEVLLQEAFPLPVRKGSARS